MLTAPPPPLRTIIAGSRDITDLAHVRAAMASCPWFPSVVVSGAARGVDKLGERWAAERGIPVESHPADWDKHGKHAGHLRNAEMARASDGLVAVWDGRSPGTRDMIDSARSMGLRVHVVQVVVPYPAAPPAPRAVPTIDARDIPGLQAPLQPICKRAREGNGIVPLDCLFGCAHGCGKPAFGISPAAPPAPVPVHKLPRGTVLRVGPSYATVNAECDMEAFSEAGWTWDGEQRKWLKPEGASKQKKGLEIVGVDLYARHPSAAILMMAYDLKDGLGWRVWLEGQPFPADLAAHIAAGRILEAHNSGFEQRMWLHVGVKKYGWPAMPDHLWRCSAAKARAYAYPGKLDEVGAVMKLDIQKDEAGKALIDKFTMPRNPTARDPRTRVLLQWSADVAAARAAYDKLGIPHGYHVEDIAQPKAPRAKKDQTVEMIVPGLWRVTTAGALTAETVAKDYADTLAFVRYCVRDIESEAEVSGRCPDLEGDELEWWQFGQESNAHGMHVDRVGLDNCAEIVRQCLARYDAELVQITGGLKSSQVKKITEWLAARGLHMASLDEEHVTEALERTDLTPECRRVLEIRAAAGSASVKKVFAIENTLSPDNRLRDLYIINGARTGRDTGVGAQPANLPSYGPAPHKCACGTFFAGRFSCPTCNTPLAPGAKPGEWSLACAEQALELFKKRSLAEVERVWGVGNALHAVAGCLRGLFCAAPGHDLISSDYNSIEAVAMAMVSGEKWRIDTFNGHGKIYEASAAAMFKIPFEDFMYHRGYTPEQLKQPEWWKQDPAIPGKTHHPLRKTGKIAELAFGFQGGLGSANAFGMPGNDAEKTQNVRDWRNVSPSIEWLWGGQTQGKANAIRGHGSKWDKTPFLFGVEGAFLNAIRHEGVEFKINRLDNTYTGFSYTRHGDVIWALLPSGRYLKYHAAREGAGKWEGQAGMSYEGKNTNPKNGPVGWIRMDTWGGRLVENLIQAICRDILKEAVLRLRKAGYTTVMRTYDEVVCEILKGFGSHEEFERIVEIRPWWAPDWPIRAPDSWRGLRYRKA